MVKRCPKPQVLSHFLDGELAPRKKLRLEKHLAVCTSCQEVLQELTTIKEAVAALPQRPKLEEQRLEPKASLKGRPLLWAALALAFLCLTFGVLYLQRPREFAGEYLRIHRQYEQQLGYFHQRLGLLWEEEP